MFQVQKKSILSSSYLHKREDIFKSRFHFRDALSKLYDLNLLEIPIRANPGEPPTLPKGMEYVTMSHYQDASITC